MDKETAKKRIAEILDEMARLAAGGHLLFTRKGTETLSHELGTLVLSLPKGESICLP